MYFCFIWKLLFPEIRQKFWASKAALGGTQPSILSKTNRHSANGGLFLSKAHPTREHEPNWFFGCCHHILKMFDFWPHLLLTACQKFWLVLFIYKLFLDRGRARARFSYIETTSSSILNVKCKAVEGLAKGYSLWQPMMLLMSKFFYHANCGVIQELHSIAKTLTRNKRL